MKFRTFVVAASVALAGMFALVFTVPAAANATMLPAARLATHFNVDTAVRISPTACRWTGTLLTSTQPPNPVPNAVVNLFRDGTETQSSSTDAGGGVTFTLSSISPGSTTMFIMKFPGNTRFVASQSPARNCP